MLIINEYITMLLAMEVTWCVITWDVSRVMCDEYAGVCIVHIHCTPIEFATRVSILSYINLS